MVAWRAVGVGIVQLVETPPKLDRRPRRTGTLGVADPGDGGPCGWIVDPGDGGPKPHLVWPHQPENPPGRLGSADQSMKPILVFLILFNHPLKALMLEAFTTRWSS